MEKEKEKQNLPEFSIQRIYIKDSSFEAPGTPEIFRVEWKPEVHLDLNIHNKKVDDVTYEVVVKLSVTAKLGEQTAFITELKQAGIFTVKNFKPEQLPEVLGVLCPEVLFPYAREAVSDLTVRGSFPPLHLAPINFAALYQQQAKSKKQQKEETKH
jgi:preprotein translocase subunit SecB